MSDPTVPKPIRIGTRGSLLATTQAGTVRDALIAAGHPAELVIVQTPGDLSSDPVEKIGVGVFTSALRDALAQDAAREDETLDQALAEALARNVTLIDNADAARLTQRARVLIDTLAATADADLLAGRIAR